VFDTIVTNNGKNSYYIEMQLHYFRLLEDTKNSNWDSMPLVLKKCYHSLASFLKDSLDGDLRLSQKECFHLTCKFETNANLKKAG
jgi:hypothetical protein